MNGAGKTRSVFTTMVTRLDGFLFVKKWYSLATHVIPFFIAALLLIILSVPADNLLLRLADKLQNPGWIWLPAGLLSLIATLVYLLTVRFQVRKAYLWRESDLRRWVLTATFFIALNTLMTYAVLQSVMTRATTWGDGWACFLVAVLSLTGLGWTLPSSWVKDIGVNIPDYSEAREYAGRIAEILETVRAKNIGQKVDVDAFIGAMENLGSELEKNLPNEPSWARPRLEGTRLALFALLEDAKKHFSPENGGSPDNFAPVCKCQMQTNYPDFVANLKKLAENWPEWQCPEDKRRK